MFSCTRPPDTCSRRAAMCDAPSVARVCRIMMSSVPCRTSALAGSLDTPMEYPYSILMSNRESPGQPASPRDAMNGRSPSWPGRSSSPRAESRATEALRAWWPRGRHRAQARPGRRDASSPVERKSGGHAGATYKGKSRRNPHATKPTYRDRSSQFVSAASSPFEISPGSSLATGLTRPRPLSKTIPTGWLAYRASSSTIR